MDTRSVAFVLKLTGQLMELHKENDFKARSYANAAFRLAKSRIDLEGMPLEEIEKIDGLGKSIAQKIKELNETGSISELEVLLGKTPVGVVEMLNIKGLGPKKVFQLWKELEIESAGELLYACNENRLLDLKGFGEKTQETIRKAIEFNLENKGRYHYYQAEPVAEVIIELIKEQCDCDKYSFTGEFRRKCEIVGKIEIIVATDIPEEKLNFSHITPIPVEVYKVSKSDYFKRLFETTGSENHLSLINYKDDGKSYGSEEEIYDSLGLPFIPAEMREGLEELDIIKKDRHTDLIKESDLKGVLHNHSTYSDGVDTLKDMAIYCRDQGYQYLGICDHSQTAFYAKGLKIDRVLQQLEEIEQLNEKLAPFRIFKGIESDILNDGQLDYPEHILEKFDFIVASIHSNFKMDIDKATARLIKAVENPYTTILGHPTGRLLLSRNGYPVDHKKVIDACSANGVAIEINANPHRLDIDWRWINYCMDKEVMLSINPDAHSKEAFSDMHYGVCVARKGGLTSAACLNAMPLDQIEMWFKLKKSRPKQ
jgi:DNA polymerase (family X)